jgi:thioredoxin reductase
VTERREVVVVGAGPAGLAAAIALREAGVGDVLVLEREREAGGIPRHADHTGFGLRDLRRVLSGPAYARRYAELAERAGAEIRTRAQVTGWAEPAASGTAAPAADASDGPGSLEVTSPAGRARIEARAVVLATGCRERPRPARLVPGARPPGVMTTAMLQQLVYLEHARLGGTALVAGAEHVSFSAVLTLAHAGARVAALVTEHPRHQTLAAVRWGARLRHGAPLVTGAEVTAIHGRRRVEGVDLRDLRGGAIRRVACDLVVFSAGWVPDNELAAMAGTALDPASRSPVVDAALRTTRPGLFAAGNVLHGAEPADAAALGGRHVAGPVSRWLAEGDWPARRVPIACEPPLLWAAPAAIEPGAGPPPRGRIVLRAARFHRPARLAARQDGRVLWRGRRTRIVPGRSMSIPAGWTRAVDPAGGGVSIGIEA